MRVKTKEQKRQETLKNNKVITIDRYLPTIKQCYRCGAKIDIRLEERIFNCPICGLSEDRDIKAAKTIIYFGQNY